MGPIHHNSLSAVPSLSSTITTFFSIQGHLLENVNRTVRKKYFRVKMGGGGGYERLRLSSRFRGFNSELLGTWAHFRHFVDLDFKFNFPRCHIILYFQKEGRALFEMLFLFLGKVLFEPGWV